MKLSLHWMDGLRARIVAVLLVALFAQFVGGEIIFSKIEDARTLSSHAEYLAERLAIADEIIVSAEDADRMNRLWKSELQVSVAEGSPAEASASDPNALSELQREVIAMRPHLRGRDLTLWREGAVLHGSLSLGGGKWLRFRSDEYFESHSLLFHYLASMLLLFACVILVSLAFGRMIGKPLHQLMDAAERAGKDEPVTVAVAGPREVRQVAGAFEAMQERLLMHVRERVQSLAAMSHDLRTPLTRLRLNSSLIEDEHGRELLLADIVEMEAFVTSVLDYLRGDEPELEQKADIASIIQTVVEDAQDMGDDVTYSGPARLESVTRPLKLKRTIRNIVQNAVRHAGNAHTRLEQSRSEIIVTVEDDGPGIPEKELGIVFDPFVRLDVSRSTNTGGAGLGLAISRRLVDRLGGTISLSNRTSGGLCVTIRIPH